MSAAGEGKGSGFMGSRCWDRATERAFLRGADGVIALLARAQDSGEAGREVTARLLACCFALVTQEDAGTELRRAKTLLARHSSSVTDDWSGRAWLSMALRSRAADHSDRHEMSAWTLLALPGLARRLRLWQAATRTTAVALAGGIGIDAHHVARWAAGRSLPSPAQRERMAAVLGIHAAWLAEERDDTPEIDLYRYPACPCDSGAPFTCAALTASPGRNRAALDENGPVKWCDGCGQPYLRDQDGRLLPLPLADPPDLFEGRRYRTVYADNGLAVPWPRSLWSPGPNTYTRGDLRIPPLLTQPPHAAAVPRRPAPDRPERRPNRPRRPGAEPGVWPEPGSARTTQQKIRALALWVGGTGRPLTSTGQIRLADARRLIDALTTGDAWVEVIGDASFPTRSSASLSGLQRLLVWARAAGLLHIDNGRLEQTGDAARLTADPQALREAMFEGLPEAAKALHEWPWDLSPLAEPEIPHTALNALWDTLQDADGAMRVSGVADAIWEAVSQEWQFEHQDRAEKLLRRDVPVLLKACQDAGAARLGGKDQKSALLTAFGRTRTAADYAPSPPPPRPNLPRPAHSPRLPVTTIWPTWTGWCGAWR